MSERLYFKFPNDELEKFEKLEKKLYGINITDDKTYSIRPFQSSLIATEKDTNTTILKLDLSPFISDYLITDDKEKKKTDKIIDDIYNEIIEEDKKIEKLDIIPTEYFTNNELQAYIKETQIKLNKIIDHINKE